MAAPSNQKSGVGFRHCQLFALNTSGVIAAPDENAYEGLQLSGVRSLSLPIPESQKHNHYGDDRVFAIDQLPPTEGVSGTLVVGKNNFEVDALLTGQLVATVGETKFFLRATDKQGFEAQVCMLAWRQALDTTPGASRVRYWDIRILPVCQLIPMNPEFGANPEEKSYTVWPQVSGKYPWGIAFTVAQEGATEAQIIDATTVGKPKMVAFQGDGTATVFTLPVAAQAISTAKMRVFRWVASTGVATDVSGSVTLAVDDVTFGAAVTSGDIVTVFYETA